MIAPTEDRIVVLPDDMREDVTDVGLIVKVSTNHESARQLGKTGLVVAVGPGKRNKAGRRVPLTLQTGDRIAFGEFTYREHQEGGKRYLIMQEADVCGVFESA
jgi:chaperonin GroES